MPRGTCDVFTGCGTDVLKAKAAPCSEAFRTRSKNSIPNGKSSYGAPGTEAWCLIAPRLTRIEGTRPGPHS